MKNEYPKTVIVSPQFDLTQKVKMIVHSLEEIKNLQKHRYEVRPDAKNSTTKKIIIRGTGHPIEEGLKHIGSVTMDIFVWHVYEDVS
ncbi:hypothetical protein LCGC14_0586100 [marine sediment metagenome]|uniref:DUF7352 domain-containing protein n=1 Tax=marine sediment metagenome TaxID=412755 RepID=A0A0F9RJS9_9ZZZZ